MTTTPTTQPGGEVSVADDSLDALIEAGSVPNLADLFRKAKANGVIDSAVTVYGEGST